MPVPVEDTTVLTRHATVEARYPGGVAGFGRECPPTFCTDGLVCRVSFMHPDDAKAFVGLLSGFGFLPPTPEGSPEVAVIDGTYGFQFPCSWLEAAEVELEDGHRVISAWLLGTDPSRLVGPHGWRPSASFILTNEQLERDYEFVTRKNGVETRRHKVTGQLIYQGRPRIRRKRWWEFWKA